MKNNLDKNVRGGIKLNLIVIIFIALIFVVYGFWRWNTQAVITKVSADLPDVFLQDGSEHQSFSHQSLAQLLTRFVEQGRVDYQAWSEDEQSLNQLDQYLAAVARFSPENAPQKFKHKNESLAYWVYAYNAVVIKSILNHWPLSSVNDLTTPVEIIKGLGFFYQQKYIYGGQAYSLYQIENGKIFDGESDPRVHFILNCGSESCPVLRPQLPTGEQLESFLAQAAKEFVADPKNLTIKHDEQTLYLSAIFKWNKNAFIKAVSGNNLVDYLLTISDDKVGRELFKARNYTIEFIEYDWSVNDVSDQHAN